MMAVDNSQHPFPMERYTLGSSSGNKLPSSVSCNGLLSQRIYEIRNSRLNLFLLSSQEGLNEFKFDVTLGQIGLPRSDQRWIEKGDFAIGNHARHQRHKHQYSNAIKWK
jgi:hypothetical protein